MITENMCELLHTQIEINKSRAVQHLWSPRLCPRIINVFPTHFRKSEFREIWSGSGDKKHQINFSQYSRGGDQPWKSGNNAKFRKLVTIRIQDVEFWPNLPRKDSEFCRKTRRRWRWRKPRRRRQLWRQISSWLLEIKIEMISAMNLEKKNEIWLKAWDSLAEKLGNCGG